MEDFKKIPNRLLGGRWYSVLIKKDSSIRFIVLLNEEATYAKFFEGLNVEVEKLLDPILLNNAQAKVKLRAEINKMKSEIPLHKKIPFGIFLATFFMEHVEEFYKENF